MARVKFYNKTTGKWEYADLAYGVMGGGTVTDEQIASAVEDYMAEHPEAITTVQDKSITEAKLSDGLKEKIFPTYKTFKAVFLGDSQTAVNANKTKPWWEWVVELLGITNYVNYGQNGATLSSLGASGKRMCEMYANMASDASIVFVMGGVNEFRTDTQTPFGTIANTTPETIYGAVRYLCQKLQAKYPRTPIVFITPTNQRLWTHKDGHSMLDLSKAITDACHMEGVLCLDAQGSLGINPAHDGSYTADGLHLNDLGSELLGKWVANQIKQHIPVLLESSGDDSGNGDSGDSGEVEKTLTSISATYSGGNVTAGTAVNDLAGVVVTAHYSDGSTENVTGYTLSGTISEGVNTITVSYGGKTTTLTVTGILEETPVEIVTLNLADYSVTEGKYIYNGNESNGGGWKYTEKIPVPANTEITVCVDCRLNPVYYDADQNYISSGDFYGQTQGTPTEHTVTTPENCAYIVINISPSTDDRSVLWIKYKK